MKNIGLTTEQALKNRAKGSNELTQRETATFWEMYKEYLSDNWIRILMIALAIEAVFSAIGHFFPDLAPEEWLNVISIFVSILAVSFIGTCTRYKQERGAKALQREASKIKCKVYRDGGLIELPINDIVCDDCVYLQTGDKIPADGVLIDGSIKVDQAALNGESREAEKVIPGNQDIPGSDDLFTKFKCFRGSVVTSGSAIMRVTEVGDNTVLGSINVSLQEKDEALTPSEEKLNRLANGIGIFGYLGGTIAAIIIMILGLLGLSHYTVVSVSLLFIHSLTVGVSIIVMAVPEGLPLMNALVQGLNVGKMLKAHIYVKNPKAIETAGYLTHLFTDKTGTLTNGKMTVANVITGDSVIYESFRKICNLVKREIVIGAGVNNDATISSDGKAIGSNVTDRALMDYLAENNVEINNNGVVKKEPFDSRVKYAAVTMADGTRYLKGAPDIIMTGCQSYMDKNGNEQPMTEDVLQTLKATWDAQTERAMRVIAIVKE